MLELGSKAHADFERVCHDDNLISRLLGNIGKKKDHIMETWLRRAVDALL